MAPHLNPRYFTISIHALRGEGDSGLVRYCLALERHFNPRPPWGGRPTKNTNERANNTISIHALRGEGDARRSYHGNDNYNFNPRPPWGGRLLGFFMRTRLKIFQSTPSVGRATQNKIIASFTRPKFQSTPSVGRATNEFADSIDSAGISIHALRGEGDDRSRKISKGRLYFNPRPPWGGRPGLPVIITTNLTFQSTPSVGRATALTGSIQTRKYISIHALRGEGDTPASAALSVIRYFNPRPPWGGRHRLVNFIAKSVKFQSTPSVGRATRLFKRF